MSEEILRLKEENETLREALKRYADLEVPELSQDGVQWIDLGEIARAALKGREALSVLI